MLSNKFMARWSLILPRTQWSWWSKLGWWRMCASAQIPTAAPSEQCLFGQRFARGMAWIAPPISGQYWGWTPPAAAMTCSLAGCSLERRVQTHLGLSDARILPALNWARNSPSPNPRGRPTFLIQTASCWICHPDVPWCKDPRSESRNAGAIRSTAQGWLSLRRRVLSRNFPLVSLEAGACLHSALGCHCHWQCSGQKPMIELHSSDGLMGNWSRQNQELQSCPLRTASPEPWFTAGLEGTLWKSLPKYILAGHKKVSLKTVAILYWMQAAICNFILLISAFASSILSTEITFKNVSWK